jgi:transaldolase
MKFYIDTANVDEIRKANDMGIIAGVTTNPSLIAKEGRDYAETLKEIATIVDGPISGEVKATTTDAEGMIAEGRAIYALDPKHMVVKIPMTAEGLKAIKVLSAEGIPTNCTLIFSANQALLAARAGADIATVPYKVIEQMLHHPLTDAGIEKFKADYTKVFGA